MIRLQAEVGQLLLLMLLLLLLPLLALALTFPQCK
jgi:hypothetical protein